MNKLMTREEAERFYDGPIPTQWNETTARAQAAADMRGMLRQTVNTLTAAARTLTLGDAHRTALLIADAQRYAGKADDLAYRSKGCIKDGDETVIQSVEGHRITVKREGDSVYVFGAAGACSFAASDAAAIAAALTGEGE